MVFRWIVTSKAYIFSSASAHAGLSTFRNLSVKHDKVKSEFFLIEIFLNWHIDSKTEARS